MKRKLSLETRLKMAKSHTGVKRPYFTKENNPAWRGNKAGYQALHDWLVDKNGNANKCEGKECKKISKKFEWAKKKGHEYTRNVEDYLQLCISCHRTYDYTEVQRKAASKVAKSRIGALHPLWKGGKEVYQTEEWKENRKQYIKKYRAEHPEKFGRNRKNIIS